MSTAASTTPRRAGKAAASGPLPAPAPISIVKAASKPIQKSSRCRCGPIRWRTNFSGLQSLLAPHDNFVRSALLARTVRATGLTSRDALALIPHGEEAPLRRLEPSGD